MNLVEWIVGERIWGKMASAPTVVPPDPDALRKRMGAFIFDFEAETRNGHVAIENLPSNDGGGAREVAGINMRYDAPEEAQLEKLIKSGLYDDVKTEAIRYYIDDTNYAEKMAGFPATEFLARDIIFNRGQRAAVVTFQQALEVTADGLWGPVSAAAMKQAEAKSINDLIDRTTNMRRWYEEKFAGTRDNLQQGLENRWEKAKNAAKTFL